MNPIYTEKYLDLTIEIYQDDDAQRPDESGDDSLLIITTRNRYFEVIPKGFSLDRCRNYRKDYHILPLFAYIHSGVALSLGRMGQFSDPWDSSQIGVVLVKKRCGFRNIQKAAASLVDEWNDYLSGNCWGFMVKDVDGEQLDSCWGFNGDWEKYAIVEARESAKSCAAARSRQDALNSVAIAG